MPEWTNRVIGDYTQFTKPQKRMIRVCVINFFIRFSSNIRTFFRFLRVREYRNLVPSAFGKFYSHLQRFDIQALDRVMFLIIGFI